ncbi:uncharacterized protein QYS62_011491 [Fusarium acuminatum]|uniref:Nucleoside phosphorylase domain-containing protein n=1 Tax=Fusarium acuminatum TaxID=5515 RepID=A0ABZ2XAU4_9HYPO
MNPASSPEPNDETQLRLPKRQKTSTSNAENVIACLPQGQYGNINSASVLTNLKRTFPSIRHGLMVGIGGGAPANKDIRLGDIVVGTRVMQYDLGKILSGGGIQRTAIPKSPDRSLCTAVTNLRASHEIYPIRVPAIIQERMQRQIDYHRPSAPDHLFLASYQHDPSMANCQGCDQSQLEEREARRCREPKIHYGAIASSNQVMKDAVTRDKLAQELDIICFEMEAAGLMDVLHCLPIRGICDYSDSHKAKDWQKYAAAVAAAYAREFLEALPATGDASRDSWPHARFRMYRSLLLQFLEGFPDLQRILDDTDLISRNQVTCPLLNILKDLFRSAVSSLEKRALTCFVDALDECDEQQVRDMVEIFEEVAEQCVEHNMRFQVCFSSRHYPYIDIKSGIRLTLEGQDGRNKDLRHYISKHLGIQDPALIDELKQMMLEKAAGVFLWVALVVDILNKENHRGRKALRSRLQAVPSKLSELFKDILTRDQENMEDLLLSILWIFLAERPLNPGEYYHAIWSGLSLKSLADVEMSSVNTPDASDCFNKCIISSSKGLAEVTKAKKPTVQFIHESVRDFLIKDKDTIKDNLLEQFPFLEYASQFVLGHADDAAHRITQQQFISEFPVTSWVPIFNISEKHKVRRYNQQADILYILANRGLPNLIRTRLEITPAVEGGGGRYRHPLLAAMAKGNKDSVTALLGLSSSIYKGIDITDGLKCKVDSVRQDHTPFSWACEEGYVAIAKILLQNGARVVDADLVRIIENGHPEIVKMLLDKGVDDTATDEYRSTALHKDSYRDPLGLQQSYDAMVRRCLGPIEPSS